MPAWLKLHIFGAILIDMFGEHAYLVGSSTESKTWRDVDVRLRLEDDAWLHLLGREQQNAVNGLPLGSRKAALELAFSALGKEITGLPIDFQIQDQATWSKHKDRWRDPLGLDVDHGTVVFGKGTAPHGLNPPRPEEPGE